MFNFTDVGLSGQMPKVISCVFGASLCALSKIDGGIRFIAVGNTICRPFAEVSCSAVCDRVTERLAPLQLGFGVKQRAEATTRAMHCCIRNLGPKQ